MERRLLNPYNLSQRVLPLRCPPFGAFALSCPSLGVLNLVPECAGRSQVALVTTED